MATIETVGLDRLARSISEPAGPGKGNDGVGFRLFRHTEHGKRQPMSEVSVVVNEYACRGARLEPACDHGRGDATWPMLCTWPCRSRTTMHRQHHWQLLISSGVLQEGARTPKSPKRESELSAVQLQQQRAVTLSIRSWDLQTFSVCCLPVHRWHVCHAAADRETCSSSGRTRTLGPQQAAGLALDQQQATPVSRISMPMGPPAPPASAAAGPGMPRLGSLLVAAQMATCSSVGASSGVSPLLPATQATLRATTASVIAAEVLAAVSRPLDAASTSSPAKCSALVAELLAVHCMGTAGSPSAVPAAASMNLPMHAQQQQEAGQQGLFSDSLPGPALTAQQATAAAGSQEQYEQLLSSPLAAAAAATDSPAAGLGPIQAHLLGASAEPAADSGAPAPAAAAAQQEDAGAAAMPAAAAAAASSLPAAVDPAAPCSHASTAVLQDSPPAGQVELPSWLREPSAELQAGMAICKASLATATAALARLSSPRGLCMQAAAAAGAPGPSMHAGMLGLSVTAGGGTASHGAVMSPAQHASPAFTTVSPLGARWSAQEAAAVAVAVLPDARAHGSSSPAAISPVGPWLVQGAAVTAAASPAARAYDSSSPAGVSPAAISPVSPWPMACLSPPPPPQHPVPALQLPAAALPAQTAAVAVAVFGVPAREPPADAAGMVWGLPVGPAAAAAAAVRSCAVMQASPVTVAAMGSPGAERFMLPAVKTLSGLDAADCEMDDAGSCSSTPKAAQAAVCARNAAAGGGLRAAAARLAVYERQQQQGLCSPSVGGGCSSVALTADDASSPLLVSDEDVSSGISEGGSASAAAAVVVNVAISSRSGSGGTAATAAGVKPKQQEGLQAKQLVSG